jgi:hypothetical protein
MTVIVCIDDAKGMTFNKRRQSRDEAIYRDVISCLGGKRLFAAPMSKILFDGIGEVNYSDDPLRDCGDEDFCFIEDRALADCKDKISAMIIYKWNKKYPSSTKLDLIPSELGLKLRGTFEFKGKSHDKITKEVYR